MSRGLVILPERIHENSHRDTETQRKKKKRKNLTGELTLVSDAQLSSKVF
jgi:hypothetical protein